MSLDILINPDRDQDHLITNIQDKTDMRVDHHFDLTDQILFQFPNQDPEILPDLVPDRQLSEEEIMVLKFLIFQVSHQGQLIHHRINQFKAQDTDQNLSRDHVQDHLLLLTEEEILLTFLIIHADILRGQIFHRTIFQPTDQDINPDLVQDHPSPK